MTTTYTKITKPTGTNYTDISGGYIMFDDPMITFDASISFDGARAIYTKITKASDTSYINIPKAT